MNELRECRKPTCTLITYRHDGYCKPHATLYRLLRPYNTTGEARRIVTQCKTDGWTWQAMAEATGLSKAGLWNIAHGKYDNSTQHTVDKLRAIDGKPPRNNLREAWPTRRRVQSLHQAGYSTYQIADMAGMKRPTVTKLLHVQQVTRDTAERVDRVWRALYNQPVRKPAKVAKDKGWVPPMWWDNIDDPDEIPGVSHCIICHSPDRVHRTKCKACRRAEALRKHKAKKRAA